MKNTTVFTVNKNDKIAVLLESAAKVIVFIRLANIPIGFLRYLTYYNLLAKLNNKYFSEMPFSFLSCCQLPQECLYLYLKRGETLTYGTRESLTYGIGKSLTPFEVVSGAENRMNFEDIRKR